MKETFLSLLVCPKYKRPLVIDHVSQREGDRIRTGELLEPVSGSRYPIREFIPYFADTDNYARSFGVEWNIHDRTQYDGYSGHKLSHERFKAETKWPADLRGQVILEARF